MTLPINIGSVTAGSPSTGGDFLSSGTVSGTVIEHFQTVSIYYKLTTRTDPNGSWFPGGTVTSGLSLTFDGFATNEIYDFNTSAAGDANIRQEHVVNFSSFTADASTSAMGTEGIIYTTLAGVTRQWATSTDVSGSSSWHYPKVWFPISENTMWQTDNTPSNALVIGILGQLVKGGLHYSTDQQAVNVTTTEAQPLFSLALLA